MASHPPCEFQFDPNNFNSEFVLDMLCDLSYAVQQVSGGSSASLTEINSEIQSIQNQINSLNSQLSSLNSQLIGLGSDKVDRVGGSSTGQTLNNATFTGSVTGLRKGMVRLGNVDDTSDLNKPISTATQAALDLKANNYSPTLTGTPLSRDIGLTSSSQIATKTYVDNSIQFLVDQSNNNGVLDTIKELASAVGNDPNFYNEVLGVTGLSYELHSYYLKTADASFNKYLPTVDLSSTYLKIANAYDFSFNSPQAKTQALDNSSNLIATTAFVKNYLASSSFTTAVSNVASVKLTLGSNNTPPTNSTPAGSKAGDIYIFQSGSTNYIYLCTGVVAGGNIKWIWLQSTPNSGNVTGTSFNYNI